MKLLCNVLQVVYLMDWILKEITGWSYIMALTLSFFKLVTFKSYYVFFHKILEDIFQNMLVQNIYPFLLYL
jgi:hypothetical protein